MKQLLVKGIGVLLSIIVILNGIAPNQVNASEDIVPLEDCTSPISNGLECEENIYLSEEEIEKLGGSIPVEYDATGLDETLHITREDFQSEEEYQQYLADTSYITPRALWLIPPALAVVSRVGAQLVVRQTLRTTTKNIVIRNGSLANRVHPVSKVRFNANGFPIFSPKIQLALPANMIKASNSVQFKNLNQQLLIQVQTNSTVRAKFTASQINQIKNLKTPDGYTWHHHQNRGVMQLVNSKIHQQTGHTGGRAIWGSL